MTKEELTHITFSHQTIIFQKSKSIRHGNLMTLVLSVATFFILH